MDLKFLRNWIIQDEGIERFPYMDTTNHLSIGIGRNLSENGLRQSEIYYLFDNDIQEAILNLQKYSWFTSSPANVQEALVNMCFNLGINKLLKFKKMIAAICAKDFNKAAEEALDSLWAKQVQNRAHEIAKHMRKSNVTD